MQLQRCYRLTVRWRLCLLHRLSHTGLHHETFCEAAAAAGHDLDRASLCRKWNAAGIRLRLWLPSGALTTTEKRGWHPHHLRNVATKQLLKNLPRCPTHTCKRRLSAQLWLLNKNAALLCKLSLPIHSWLTPATPAVQLCRLGTPSRKNLPLLAATSCCETPQKNTHSSLVASLPWAQVESQNNSCDRKRPRKQKQIPPPFRLAKV